MGQPIPAQHPSVVLRSHFRLVKTLLAIAMAAVIGLTAAVVILANDEDQLDSASKATPAVLPQPQTPPGTRYDGGPEEGTRGAIATPQVPAVSPAPSSIASQAGPAYQDLRAQPPVSRYDGGPEEGTRGATSFPQAQAPVSRYDGGPEEGTRGPVNTQFKQRAGGPTFIPQGPGAR